MFIGKAAAQIGGTGGRKRLERRLQDTLGQWAHEFDLPQRHDQRGIGTREILSMCVSGLTSSLSPEIARGRLWRFRRLRSERNTSATQSTVWLARQTNDQELCRILREMAAEWLRLVKAQPTTSLSDWRVEHTRVRCSGVPLKGGSETKASLCVDSCMTQRSFTAAVARWNALSLSQCSAAFHLNQDCAPQLDSMDAKPFPESSPPGY